MIHPSIIIALAICGFVTIWCFVFKVISLFGWGKLAERYTSFTEPSGTRLAWQSLVLGNFARYNNCTTIHISQAGLHLALPKFLRFGHPPLLIDWAAVRFLKETDTLGGRRFIYDLGTPRILRVTFPINIHRAIQNRPGV